MKEKEIALLLLLTLSIAAFSVQPPSPAAIAAVSSVATQQISLDP